MPATLKLNAKDGSTYIVSYAFTDENGDGVVPDTIKWSLYNERDEIVNGREDVVIIPSAPSGYIVLQGDDLLFSNGRKRTIVMKATYTGRLGFGLPLNDSATFYIDDLPGIP
jgi:hypothetical protein